MLQSLLKSKRDHHAKQRQEWMDREDRVQKHLVETRVEWDEEVARREKEQAEEFARSLEKLEAKYSQDLTTLQAQHFHSWSIPSQLGLEREQPGRLCLVQLETQTLQTHLVQLESHVQQYTTGSPRAERSALQTRLSFQPTQASLLDTQHEWESLASSSTPLCSHPRPLSRQPSRRGVTPGGGTIGPGAEGATTGEVRHAAA
jgi:hypothetical protein